MKINKNLQQETELAQSINDQKEHLIHKDVQQFKVKKPVKNLAQEFNPNIIPGDWRKTSRRVGAENKTDQFCSCCGFQTQRKQIGIFAHPLTELSYLGSGIPLFFDFIKFCIFILSAILIVQGVYNLISNKAGGLCTDSYKLASVEQKNLGNQTKIFQVCGTSNSSYIKLSLFNKLSFSNNVWQESAGYQTQQILNLIAIFPLMAIFQWFRRQIRKTAKIVDESNEDGTDYTICVKNIPTLEQLKKLNNAKKDNEINYQQDIENFFKNKVQILDQNNQPTNPDVEKVVLTFDMNIFNKKNQELQDKVKEKKQILGFCQKQNNFASQWQNIKKIDSEINQKQVEIQEFCDNLKTNQELQQKYFAGIAFVTFKYEDQKKQILKKYSLQEIARLKNFLNSLTPDASKYLVFENQVLIVEEAVDPSDVFWDNQHYTTKEKLKFRAKTFLINAAIIVLSFVIISALVWIQQFIIDHEQGLNSSNPEQQKGGLLGKISLIISFIIIGFNISIAQIMIMLGKPEHYSTRTSYLTSCCKKMAIAQFINTCIMQFIATRLFHINPSALILNVSTLFITQLWLNPVKILGYPGYVMRGLIVWLNYRKNKKLRGGELQEYKNLLQAKKNAASQNKHLNEADQDRLLAYPEFPHYIQTAQVICFVLFTVFYAYLVPLGLVSTIVLLTILYWCHKYNLIYKSSVMNDLSSELAKQLIEFMEYIPLIFGCSIWLCDKLILKSEVSVCTYIIIIISIINAFLPMDKINEKLFYIGEDKSLTETYKEKQVDFDVDYDRENPVYKQKALSDWISAKKTN